MHQSGRGRIRRPGQQNNLDIEPLLTNHQRIKDLELELQVLKHKREIVNREHQNLSLARELSRKRQYDDTNRNVSNTFGNVWQASSPKRANAPQQPHPWIDTTHNSFGPMSNSMPTHHIPPLLGQQINPPLIPSPALFNPVDQRHDRPMNVRKEFRNTHGIKKNRRDPPNKLNTYPLQVRKNLVSKATESQLSKRGNHHPSMILREDQPVSNQLSGRLELALGHIVKEICFKCGNETFQTLVAHPQHRRIIKHVVRERIRALMLNKAVGPVIEIIKKYRQKFPLDTDREIVDLVLNSPDPNFKNANRTESPEDFFKRNITTLLPNKVQEMSSNLVRMYKDMRFSKSSVFGNIRPNKAGLGGSVSNNETALKLLRGLTGKYVTIEETEILHKYYTELIEDILRQKLPEYLPQCKEKFLKIFDMDNRFKAIKSMAIKRVSVEIMKKGMANIENQNKINPKTSNNEDTQEEETDHDNGMEEEVVTKENDTEEVTVNDNNELEKEVDPKNNESEKTANETIEIDDDVIIVSANKIETKSDNVNNEMITDAVSENNDIQKETLLENMPSKEAIAEADKAEEISEALPLEIDPQESSSIPKTLSTSSEQQTSEAIDPTVLVVKETKPAETIAPTTPIAIKTELSSTPKTLVTVSSALAKELPYYVKLIGRPTLPNRALICEFLNNYQPTSIKKHKTINNLLVVGFINQEDYSRILKANETVIGDITIIIKASEKVNAGKVNESISSPKQDNSDNVVKEPIDEDKAEQEAKEGNVICKEATDGNVRKSDEGNEICKEATDSGNVRESDEGHEICKETTDGNVRKLDEGNEICTEATDSGNVRKSDEGHEICKEATDGNVRKSDEGHEICKEATDGNVRKSDEGNEICKEATDSANVRKSNDGIDLIGKELDDQITNLLSTIKGEEDTIKSNTPSSLEPITETEDGTTTAETKESDKTDKVPIKANVKESGRSTPVRSSRLGNLTPSTIRTRRSSRLLQE